MAGQTGPLVILRNYEPPPGTEMAEVLSRVYQRLLLTPPTLAGRMKEEIEQEKAQRVGWAREKPEGF